MIRDIRVISLLARAAGAAAVPSTGARVVRHASARAFARICVGVCLAAILGTASASASQTRAVAGADARAKVVFARAVELEARSQYADALPLLWEAAQLAPEDAEIQNRLGEGLERIGALDAAMEAYRRAVARDPASRKATNNLILVLAKAGKSTEAVALARAAVDAAPADADRLFTLGLAQAEYDLDAAIDTFRRVLTLAPRHSLARYNLALTLKRADRPADATTELRRLIEMEKRPEAYYNLGVIYWQQGDLSRAVDALRAAIDAKSDYADAHYTLGTVLKAKGDLNGAAAALRRAIALTPTSSGTHYVLAQVLRMQGDEDAARKELAESERLRQAFDREHEASVLTFLGIQKLDAGAADAAVDLFKQATAAFEPYAPAHYQLGLALQRLNKADEARAAFARAHQLNPALVPPPDVRR
jgi:eukaryotic-like serine/threonine-protein kinase